ncbi:MAG: ROK family protein [Candidatus Beckwithbacteria bacterium]
MYIGIDIGGTHTRIAGSPSLKNIKLVRKKIISTPKFFEEGIFEIITAIREITNKPKGIGIGVAGRTTEDGKEFTHSINLSTWTNKPIIKTVEKEFGCFAYIENDAVSQSYAEAFYGAKLATNFLYLVWGTGVGGALVSETKGKIQSTKLGRLYLDKWERKFGGKHLEKRFGKTAKYLEEKEWAIVLSEFKVATQDLSNQLKVDSIVVSGGIVDKQKDRISKITTSILSPKILLSKLGEDIGVYGGLALIKAKTQE